MVEKMKFASNNCPEVLSVADVVVDVHLDVIALTMVLSMQICCHWEAVKRSGVI